MSRTACCFLALGIGVTLVAACGDDDVDFTGMGGSAGRGGTAGAAGAAGRGGSAGNPGNGGSAGTPGNGGTGGSAGTPGNGGTGGSAGTPGNGGTGGTGGSDIPDGGPDAEAPLPDGGGSGTCPNFTLAAAQITSGNPIVIARVIFDAGSGEAAVVLRNNDPGGFGFGDEMHLCSGPENCIPVTDLPNLTLLGQETAPIIIDDTLLTGGELAFMTNTPDVAVAFPLAYIAWGEDFVSPEPLGGDASQPPASMGDRADPNVWELGQLILPAVGDNAFIADGPSDVAAGFTTCTVE